MARLVPPRRPSARAQVAASALVGVIVGVAAGLATEPVFGGLIGWGVAAGVYVTQVWIRIWRLDAVETARLAEWEDPTRATADLLLLTAAVVSLVAVGLVLRSAAKTSGDAQLARIGLGLASVVVSWTTVHTVFTLRYAKLYYTGDDGGVDFNQERPPAYDDFAYLAFTVGMTFQVSDTDVDDSAIRRAVLRHSLLSFLFGTGILATTVNLVASVSSQ
jgi:uncharacterized membrane protein